MAKAYTHLVVLDVETTGLNPASDSIIQIGACVLDRSDLHEERAFSTFVKPTTPISPQAFAVHGKTEADLASAPSISDSLVALAAFVPKNALLCGHNVAFDAAFMKSACTEAKLPYPFDYHSLDTWSVAFFVISAEGITLPSHSLDALCAHFGIPRGTKHDALEDVRATAEVLRHLLAIVKGKGAPTGGGSTGHRLA